MVLFYFFQWSSLLKRQSPLNIKAFSHHFLRLQKCFIHQNIFDRFERQIRANPGRLHRIRQKHRLDLIRAKLGTEEPADKMTSKGHQPTANQCRQVPKKKSGVSTIRNQEAHIPTEIAYGTSTNKSTTPVKWPWKLTGGECVSIQQWRKEAL